MEDYQLLIDLHRHNHRQGPGSDAETKRALDLSMMDQDAPLKIADIGCGTGASTLLLAEQLDAQIIAVDFLQEFLDELNSSAVKAGLTDKISTICCSMENLPFEDQEFDVIWSEGAIYNIGFEKGVKDWNRYLKAGGLLVVSEITWITDHRSTEIQQHWDNEYPEIDVASSKIRVLEKSGYSPIGYFILPENCWLENYYQPLQNEFENFLERNGSSEEAQMIVESEKREIELYEKHKADYSYGVYIARKMVQKDH